MTKEMKKKPQRNCDGFSISLHQMRLLEKS